MPQNKSLDIGKVLSQALETMGAHLLLFLAIAVPFTGLTAFIGAWVQFDYLNGLTGVDMIAVFTSREFLTRMAILLGIGILIGAVVHGALTRATITRLSGGSPTLVDSLEAGFTSFLPVALIGLIFGIGVALGTLLFIVPGILLWLAWSMAIPACVTERLGPIEALKRSLALTNGERGRLFLLLLILSVGMWVLGFVLGIVTGFLKDSQVAAALVQALVAAISAMANTSVMAAAYFNLRAVKEGGAPDELETVFS